MNQVEVRGNEMLRGRVVQFLRDALAFLLLKVDETPGKLLRLLLQRYTLSDIRNHTYKPQWLAGIGELEFSIDLQPAQFALPTNPANRVEVASGPHRILQRLLERVGVVWM